MSAMFVTVQRLLGFSRSMSNNQSFLSFWSNVMDRQSSLYQRKIIIALAAHTSVQSNESTFDDLFKASEMLSPSTFLRLGGTLFEHYIIAFGGKDDSIYVRRGVMKRQRAQKKSIYSETISNDLKKKYLIRFE